MSGIDWGNAPAWGALIVAGVGGWIALAQLRQQQRIIARELKRGAALEEARLRGQAEAVDLAWSAGNGQGTFIKVINSSHRPIRDLECKIVSEKDDGVIALPVRAGEMQLRKASGASTYIRRVTGGDRPKRPAGADALNVIGSDWTLSEGQGRRGGVVQCPTGRRDRRILDVATAGLGPEGPRPVH
jgi:hypothetical protein